MSIRSYKYAIEQQSSVLKVLALIAAFGGIGFAMLSTGHAATFAVDTEAESGTITGLASAGDPNGASGNASIRFGSSSSGSAMSPPASICGNAAMLTGPSTAPAGAVTVAAGNNSGVNFGQAGTTYWFATGTHTLGTGQYDQISPGNNSTFLGAPGAIIDGQNLNNFAFTQRATGVTIKYLTVQHFTTGDPQGNGSDQGVVNHDSADGWTIQHNTLQNNHGAATMIGSNNNISYNCLQNNGQYGFNAYEPVGTDLGPANIVMDHNEISGNDSDLIQNKASANGNFGGGKLWQTVDATVTNNYVHGNRYTGIWFDSDNTGADIENNYFADNEGVALWYEVSYNALIKDNTFVRNDLVKGAGNSGFPEAAIYLSESGGDSRVKRGTGRYSTLAITSNTFTDNWGGISVYESSDRFCGNGETSYCTLVNTGTANINTCTVASINNSATLQNDCRWKAQNISVDHNIFNFTRANVANCTTSKVCGENSIYAQYGTSAVNAFKAFAISNQMTAATRNIHFTSNTYNGPWQFYMATPATNANTAGIIQKSTWVASPPGQDTTSTFNP